MCAACATKPEPIQPAPLTPTRTGLARGHAADQFVTDTNTVE